MILSLGPLINYGHLRNRYVHTYVSVREDKCCILVKAKLEQLLEIYPPEEIESRRWEKIAAALGNRTVKQVIFLVITFK